MPDNYEDIEDVLNNFEEDNSNIPTLTLPDSDEDDFLSEAMETITEPARPKPQAPTAAAAAVPEVPKAAQPNSPPAVIPDLEEDPFNGDEEKPEAILEEDELADGLFTMNETNQPKKLVPIKEVDATFEPEAATDELTEDALTEDAVTEDTVTEEIAVEDALTTAGDDLVEDKPLTRGQKAAKTRQENAAKKKTEDDDTVTEDEADLSSDEEKPTAVINEPVVPVRTAPVLQTEAPAKLAETNKTETSEYAETIDRSTLFFPEDIEFPDEMTLRDIMYYLMGQNIAYRHALGVLSNKE